MTRTEAAQTIRFLRIRRDHHRGYEIARGLSTSGDYADCCNDLAKDLLFLLRNQDYIDTQLTALRIA